MHLRNAFLKISLLFALAGMIGACSSPNDKSPIFDSAGKHAANWIVDHRASFLSNYDDCRECHGSNLLGGIAGVSCFSPERSGQACHAKGPGNHPDGWRDPALHGATAKSQPGSNSGFQRCQACHGADFSGGAVRVSCFTAGRDTGPCHVTNGVPSGSPHAPVPWRTYPAPTHTNTVDDADGSNAAVCSLCHTAGANLRTPIITTYTVGKPGCFNNTLCHGQMGHPVGWAQPVNHGAAAKSNLTLCQQCHSGNSSGGPGSNPRFNVQVGRLFDAATGNTGCEVCHVPFAAHPRVLQIPTVFGAIVPLNPIGTPWYLHCTAAPSGFDACNRCHGPNLDGVGGVSGATACTFCHRVDLPTTLKECKSCHSSPPSGNAYPNTAFAHPKHGTLNVANVCGQCHDGLGSITLDHFLRAKNNTTSLQAGAVRFGAFAQTGGLSPVFNETTLQCTNIYCHGATLSGGADKSPVWSDANYLTAAGCGTCHGFPPTNVAPHAGFTSSTPCKSCHTHVNATNTGFDDPTKHVNGIIDVVTGAPHAFPYPGSVHLSAAGINTSFPGCVISSCHANGNAVGVYPVASGTPPDCRACHTKLPPGNSCGSCHGTAATGGRPEGSAFPDVSGRHFLHTGLAPCLVCHGITNGSGSTSHGPSNRTAHGDADVNIQFTPIPAAAPASDMTYSRSGLNDGHGTCTGLCHTTTRDKNHSGDVW